MPFRPSPCVAETTPHKRTEEFFNIAPPFREFCVPRPGTTDEIQEPLTPKSPFGRFKDKDAYLNTRQQSYRPGATDDIQAPLTPKSPFGRFKENKGPYLSTRQQSYGYPDYGASDDDLELVGDNHDAAQNGQSKHNFLVALFNRMKMSITEAVVGVLMLTGSVTLMILLAAGLALAYRMIFPRMDATSRSIKRISESYGKWEKYLPLNSPYTHAVSPYFSNDRFGNNIVQCFPSWTNGSYVLQWASPVELDFLGFIKTTLMRPHLSLLRMDIVQRELVRTIYPTKMHCVFLLCVWVRYTCRGMTVKAVGWKT
jgi:hypothetical protein